jgi:hypothetical protein
VGPEIFLSLDEDQGAPTAADAILPADEMEESSIDHGADRDSGHGL